MEASLQTHMQRLLHGWANKVELREHIGDEAWHGFKCNCLERVATIIAQYSQQHHSPLDGSPAPRVLADQLSKLVNCSILTEAEKTLALQLYMQDLPLTLPRPTVAAAEPALYVSAFPLESSMDAFRLTFESVMSHQKLETCSWRRTKHPNMCTFLLRDFSPPIKRLGLYDHDWCRFLTNRT